MCSLLIKRSIKKSKSKKKIKKEEKKRGAHKKHSATLFCGVFCLIQVCCSLSYLFPSTPVSLTCLSQLVLGTRIGQQREQVHWVIIQHCYLLLIYVPHIIISLFAFPRYTCSALDEGEFNEDRGSSNRQRR